MGVLPHQLQQVPLFDMASAAVEDEVMRVRKQLEKIVEETKNGGSSSSGRAMDLLKTLGRTEMSLQILTKTRIGMTVNSLRLTRRCGPAEVQSACSCTFSMGFVGSINQFHFLGKIFRQPRKSSEDEEVTALCKSLIKAWKRFLDGGDKDGKEDKKKQDKSSSSSSVAAAAASGTASPAATAASSNGKADKSSSSKRAGDQDEVTRSFPPKANDTSDQVRLGCRKLLAAALKGLTRHVFPACQKWQKP